MKYEKNNKEYLLLNFKTIEAHMNYENIIVTIYIKFSNYISRHEI